MANLKQFWGTYITAEVTIHGSFRINGQLTPDDIRDGNTNVIKSVVRDSAGLFTVTFDDNIQVPEKLVDEGADIQQAAAPTNLARAHIVRDSWSMAGKSFKVAVRKVTDNTASDADDNDRVTFRVTGSFMGIGVD